MINLGSGKIKGLRLGSSKISKAYLGSNLIWPIETSFITSLEYTKYKSESAIYYKDSIPKDKGIKYIIFDDKYKVDIGDLDVDYIRKTIRPSKTSIIYDLELAQGTKVEIVFN